LAPKSADDVIQFGQQMQTRQTDSGFVALCVT
jgi:hypothetical protein